MSEPMDAPEPATSDGMIEAQERGHPRLSYLPALKDRNGNRYIGVMGQYDDVDAARTKMLADGIFYIPFGLVTDGLVEYDSETGLPNAPCDLTIGGIRCGAAVISGPLFDEAVRQPSQPHNSTTETQK